MSNSAPLFNSPSEGDIKYTQYIDESQIEAIRELISRDLSEPYSIFTYRYFINNWPNLCWLAHIDKKLIGVVVNKADRHRNGRLRGYVAMLAVDSEYRKQKIGTKFIILQISHFQTVGSKNPPSVYSGLGGFQPRVYPEILGIPWGYPWASQIS